jgi:YD repeat-containing protein
MLLLMCLAFLSSDRLNAQSSVGFHYFYDDLGQLTKVIDSTGTVIEYVYDPVGNILQVKRSNVAPLSQLPYGAGGGAIAKSRMRRKVQPSVI